MEQLIARLFDHRQILLQPLRLLQMLSGQGGKAQDGIHRGADIVRHVGQEGTAGNGRRPGLFQGALQRLPLAQSVPDHLVYTAGGHDHLLRRSPLPHVHHMKLEILHPLPLQHPVGHIRDAAAMQPVPDPLHGEGPGQ